jgi:hypothetical protein
MVIFFTSQWYNKIKKEKEKRYTLRNQPLQPKMAQLLLTVHFGIDSSDRITTLYNVMKSQAKP